MKYYICRNCANEDDPCILKGELHQPNNKCPWYHDYIATWVETICKDIIDLGFAKYRRTIK